MKFLISSLCLFAPFLAQANDDACSCEEPVCTILPYYLEKDGWKQISQGFDALKAGDATAALISFQPIVDECISNLTEETFPLLISGLIGSLLSVDNIGLANEFYKEIGKATISILTAVLDELKNMDEDDEDDDDDEDFSLDIIESITSHTNMTKEDLQLLAQNCKDELLRKLAVALFDF